MHFIKFTAQCSAECEVVPVKDYETGQRKHRSNKPSGNRSPYNSWWTSEVLL